MKHQIHQDLLVKTSNELQAREVNIGQLPDHLNRVVYGKPVVVKPIKFLTTMSSIDK